MKTKKITPLGYLLKLLNISYTELAAEIHLERSSISKWTLGTRTFGLTSEYYHEVVSYLLKINKTKKRNRLEYFFTQYYKDSEASVEECVNAFLNEKEISESFQKYLLNEQEMLTYCDIGVSVTVQGRFILLMEILEEAMASKKKEEIILFDKQQFGWLKDDRKSLEKLKDKLGSLLEKGHKITLISDIHYLEDTYIFGFVLVFLYRYRDFSEYFYPTDKNPKIPFSYYVLKGKTTVQGTSMADGRLYSIVLKDEFSTIVAWESITGHLKNCTPHGVLQEENQRRKAFYFIHQVASNEDVIYLYTSALSFVSMSRELLIEILIYNKVKKERVEQVLDLHEHHQEKTAKNSKAPFRHFCYKHHIEEMLKCDYYYLEELSYLVDKKIMVPHELVLRHVKDTVKKLEISKGYHIGLIYDPLPIDRTEHSFLCKKNHYLISFNVFVRFSRDLGLVNQLVMLLDKQWCEGLPEKSKDQVLIRSWLESLIK